MRYTIIKLTIMDKIRCIYCGKEFEINEALREHIKSQELSKLRKEHKRELDEYRAKLIAAENTELELRRSREIFEEEKQKFELEKQRAIDEARDEIRKKAYNEAEEIHKFKEKEKYHDRPSKKSLGRRTKKS